MEWIRREARQLDLCVKLVPPIVTGAEAPAVEALEGFFQDADTQSRWRKILRLQFFDDSNPIEANPIQRALDEFPLEVARLWFGHTVNERISGIRLALDLPGGFQADTQSIVNRGGRSDVLGFDFQAMVQIAYLHVAHLVVEKASIGHCEECGKAFEREDPRQRFCPPGDTYRESQCGNRHRNKKWRAKKGSET